MKGGGDERESEERKRDERSGRRSDVRRVGGEGGAPWLRGSGKPFRAVLGRLPRHGSWPIPDDVSRPTVVLYTQRKRSFVAGLLG